MRKSGSILSPVAAGFAGGIPIFLLYLLVFSSSTLSTEFVAAVVGAIVGGAISFVVQLVALSAAAAERQERQREAWTAVGRSMVYKMIRIYSNFFHLSRHIDEGIELANKETRQPWQTTLAILNPPDRVTFTADEMSMLLAQGDDDVFNALLCMDDIHNSMVAALTRYGELREELLIQMPADSLRGNVGAAEIGPEQLGILRPKMVVLNGILKDVHMPLRQDVGEAKLALESLVSLLNAKLDLKLKVSLDHSPAALSADNARRSN